MRLFLVVFLLVSSTVKAEPSTAGVPNDKLLHFSCSSLLTSWGVKLIKSKPSPNEFEIIAASIGSFTVGVLKETYDKRRGGEFDYNDIGANTLGIVSGALLVIDF